MGFWASDPQLGTNALVNFRPRLTIECIHHDLDLSSHLLAQINSRRTFDKKLRSHHPISDQIFHRCNSQPTIYNVFMIETFYKTHSPERDKSECYVLVLTSRVSRGGKIFAFMEEHGSWNDDLQRFTYNVKAINTEEGLTYESARNLYESTRCNLIQRGFVYSVDADGARKTACAEEIPAPQFALA